MTTGVTVVALVIVVIVIAFVVAIFYFRRQNQKRAWSEVASLLGLEMESGGFMAPLMVKGTYRDHPVVLDTFTRTRGTGEDRSQQTFTRISMPINNGVGIRLTLSQEGILSQIGKRLGAEDIEVGDAELDRRFVVRGQPADDVRRLLTAEGLRYRLLSVPSMNLRLDEREILYEKAGVETDVGRLRDLFDLLSEFAAAVERMG